MTRAFAIASLGGLLTLCAAAFDLPSLYVPGLALALLAGTAGAWVALAARGAGLEREPLPATVVEDQPFELTVDLWPGRVPLPGATIAVSPGVDRRIPAGSRKLQHIAAVARFPRRGRRVVEPARLVLRDPLALATRTRRTSAAEVLVLPRVEPLKIDGAGGVVGSRGAGAAGAAAELELDSLRPYQQGTPAARIHWPTFARTGEMMERRLVGDADSRPLVILDASLPASPDALDRAVRAAASLCVALARAGGCRVLLPGDRRAVAVGADLRAWPAVHARLALVAGTVEAPRPPAATGRAAVFWITARGDGTPGAFAEAVGEERYVVAAQRHPRRQGLEIAGCAVRRLASRSRRAA